MQVITERRSRYEIYREILGYCLDSERIGLLLYMISISHSRLKRGLNKLISLGYIKKEGDLFVTTEEGGKALEELDRVVEMFSKR